MESPESQYQITGNSSTTTPSKIFAHSWESRTTTPPPPTHKPTDKLRSQTNPCLKSSRLGSREQRVYGQKSCQVYYRHIRRQQGHLQVKHQFDQLMKARQSSQQRSDSRATEWVIMTKERTMRLCFYSQIYQTKSGQQVNRDLHDTKTSWLSTITPESKTKNHVMAEEGNGRRQRPCLRKAQS